MGLFSQYTKEGHGISKEQANAPAFIQFFTILGTRIWTMVLLNLIFTAFCVPGIAIIVFGLFSNFSNGIKIGLLLLGFLILGFTGGPAIAGIVKVLRNWSRREPAFVWGDFWETYKSNFKQASIVGLIDVIVFGVLVFDLLIYKHPIMFAVVLISAIVFLFMNYYIFTMLITFKLTLPQLFKNAAIFAGVGIIRNVFITLIVGFITWIGIESIVSFHALFFIIYCCWYVTFCFYIITFITYPLIKRTMIDGYDPKTGKRIETEANES